MRCLICLGLLLLTAALVPLLSAPLPKRKDAKPAAVIDGGTWQHIADAEVRIPEAARYAIRDNKGVAEMVLVCKHWKDWNASDA